MEKSDGPKTFLERVEEAVLRKFKLTYPKLNEKVYERKARLMSGESRTHRVKVSKNVFGEVDLTLQREAYYVLRKELGFFEGPQATELEKRHEHAIDLRRLGWIDVSDLDLFWLEKTLKKILRDAKTIRGSLDYKYPPKLADAFLTLVESEIEYCRKRDIDHLLNAGRKGTLLSESHKFNDLIIERILGPDKCPKYKKLEALTRGAQSAVTGHLEAVG